MAMTGGTSVLLKSEIPEGFGSHAVKLYAYYKYTQSVADNTTTMYCGMYVTTDSGWDIGQWTDRNSGSYIGTTSNTFNGTMPNHDGTYWLTENQKFTVSHDDDGTGSATIYWKWNVNSPWGGYVYPSGSFKVNLPTIARESLQTLSAETVQMGKKVTIYTNRQSKSFTHHLGYAFLGITYEGTIKDNVGDSYEWTVPDWVSRIPNQRSGDCSIYCITYLGDEVIGDNYVDLTLTIPDKSTPRASTNAVQLGTSVTIYTDRKSSAYTHTLTYAIGEASGTIGTDVQAEKKWTPPMSLVSSFGNETSASCKITCNTYNGKLLVGTATTDITLTAPSATVPILSASTVAMGNKITITLDRESEVYTHSLTYSLKKYGTSEVVATGDIGNFAGGDYEWTVPLDLAKKIPGDPKATITVTCKTWFEGSSTVVGTESVSFTATVPENETTKPNVTMTLAPVHDLSSKFNGVFVQGKSKVKVTYTASSDYSTIKSYSTKILNAEGKTNPYTSSVLSNEGTVSIEGTVTDARGFTTIKSDSIDVISYGRPRIIPGDKQNNIVCTRCNSNGTTDPGGVYLLIEIGRKYSKVVSGGSQKNYCKLSYSHKMDAEDESSYSDPEELLEATATTDFVSVVLPNIVSSNTTAYNIRLIAEDDVGESDVVTITIPTAFSSWHVPPGGHGFTLGGYHDPAKYNVFDCLFDAEFEGNVYGKVLGLGKLPEIPDGADFDDYKDFGAYAVAEDAVAETISNCPSEVAGVLRVWSADGKGDTTGDNVYIMQEYICRDNSAIYRRSIQLTGTQSSWIYNEWKSLAFS